MKFQTTLILKLFKHREFILFLKVGFMQTKTSKLKTIITLTSAKMIR